VIRTTDDDAQPDQDSIRQSSEPDAEPNRQIAAQLGATAFLIQAHDLVLIFPDASMWPGQEPKNDEGEQQSAHGGKSRIGHRRGTAPAPSSAAAIKPAASNLPLLIGAMDWMSPASVST
jgi:hypothetical protein